MVVGSYYETADAQCDAGKVYFFNAKTGAPLNTVVCPNSQRRGWFG